MPCLLGDAVDQRAAGLLIRHVDVLERGLAARVLDLLHGGRAFRGVAPGEHDRRACRREPFRHAEADAAVSAGDDRDTAGEIEQDSCVSPELI